MRAGVDSVVSFVLFLSKKVKHVPLELKRLLGPVIVSWFLLLDINVRLQIWITLNSIQFNLI